MLIIITIQVLLTLAASALVVKYFAAQSSAKSRITFQGFSFAILGVSLITLAIGGLLIGATLAPPEYMRSLTQQEQLIAFAIQVGTLCVLTALFAQLNQRKKWLTLAAKGMDSPSISPESDIQQSPSALDINDSPRFDAFFHDSPAQFLIIDEQRTILDCNRTFARFIGETLEVIIGKSLDALVEEDEQDRLKHLSVEKVRRKKISYEIDIRLQHHDNEPLWVKFLPRIVALPEGNEGLLLLVQDIRESKSLAELISFHSQYDELTMLHNREGLEKYLAKALSIAKDNGGRIALFYIDVDQLKVVNDTCGHGAGDRLLQHLVSIIGQACDERSFFARVGGDEFAVVKLNSSEEEAKNIAESMRGAAEDFTFVWETHNYRQSISVGVALSSPTLNNVIDLLGASDAACYTAKQDGKNRVVVYAEEVDSSHHNRLDMMWVSRLQKAIQDGAFELYFQPIIKLDDEDSEHVHYEFLIRYVDENNQHVLPGEFLPAVERFGLSEQIDLWVLTTALDYLDKHPEHTARLNCCSINLTSQSIANPRIRSAILQVVESYTFPREKICFEITESSAIQNLNEAKDFLNELKTLGCNLALDDFGTGFSSFGYLKNLHVDYIKIDGSFVRDITKDKFDRAMVSSINNIGKEMDIAIIAEYAESHEIIHLLQEMNVDFAQGNAIHKPMPLYRLEDYYNN